jgi:hypothetical protein
MARCSRCKYRFAVLEDERPGDHGCPSCGFGADGPPQAEHTCRDTDGPCSVCTDQLGNLCEVCDERETTNTPQQHPHYDAWAVWMRMVKPDHWPATCDVCWQAAKDAEPREPDGEAYRGHEAAEASRWEMDRVQRELK